MTWDNLQEALDRDGVQIRDHAHFVELTADLESDEERQSAYRDYRANWAAGARGLTLDGFWRIRRRNVKGQKRSYSDASFATEDGAT